MLIKVDVTALERLPVGVKSDEGEQLSRCAASCLKTHQPAAAPPTATEPQPSDRT